MNYYVVLGIHRDADERTIRRAFRRLARRYHPDAGEGSSTDKFRLIAEAYETLADPVRRRIYDARLRSAQSRAAVRAEPIVPNVEPMTSRPSGSAPFGPFRFHSIWAMPRVDDLFDDVWRALDDRFLVGSFWRRW